MQTPWQEFRDGLEAAAVALTTGDPGPLKALWSHRSDVSMLRPGGADRGWGAVEVRLDELAGLLRGMSWRGENLTSVVGSDVGFTADVEHLAGDRRALVLRTTQVCRLEDRVWRIVHRHSERIDASAG